MSNRGRTTIKGTRPPDRTQHRLLRTNRAELKHRYGDGIDVPVGKELWTCSCANPPVWTGSRDEAEKERGEHVRAQQPEHPHPEDVVEVDEHGVVTVRYGFAQRGGQPSHSGTLTYPTKSAYDQAVDSGEHDAHRRVRWHGALAANRGDTVIGDVVDETPHADGTLSFVHPVDNPTEVDNVVE